MPTKTYITVYIGDPVDLTEYRHTALYFQFETASPLLLQITGAQGFFAYDKQDNYDLAETKSCLAKLILVADIPDSFSPDRIQAIVASTPIRNGRLNRDWNSHNWVGEALSGLVVAGCLKFDERERGVDKMMDACMEARDE